MKQKSERPFETPTWYDYVAATTAIVAVLAAIASFRSGSESSLLMVEKNNAILYQSKANKEWNNYLAAGIRAPMSLEQNQAAQKKATDLESQVDLATANSQKHFESNSRLTMASTFLEIALALSAMSILVRRKEVWLFSLLVALCGVYFLVFGVIQ